MSKKQTCSEEKIKIEEIQFRILDQDGRITKESLKAFFKPSCPPYYFINILIIVTGASLIGLNYFGVMPRNNRGFYCKDPLYSHPYRGSTITTLILFLGSIGLFVFIIIVEQYTRKGSFRAMFNRDSLYENYYYLKYLHLGFFLVLAVEELLKMIIREHRPDFFEVCRPDKALTCTEGEYVKTFSCTNWENFDVTDLVDSSQSFPSGHSAISWYASVYFAYIVHTRMPTAKTGSLLKLALIGLCIVWAMTCSVTRVIDSRHHWWDVLAGTAIGICGALYTCKIVNDKFAEIEKQSSEGNEESVPVSYHEV